MADDFAEDILTRLKRVADALDVAQQTSHAFTRAHSRAKRAEAHALKPPSRQRTRRKRVAR